VGHPLGTAHTPTHATRFNPGTVADPAFEILYLADNPTVALFEVWIFKQLSISPNRLHATALQLRFRN
jgi:hypothetical protein